MASKQSFLRLLALAFTLAPVSAFFPTKLYSVGGILGTSHEAATLDALETVYDSYFPGLKANEAVDDAFQAIADANANVDVDEQYDAPAHFDGESFPEGQARIAGLRAEIKSAVAAGDYEGAREAVGRSLHSIQDFYSHTNWVELGNIAIHPALGRAQAINRLSSTTPTCQNCTSKVDASNLKLREIDMNCAQGCKPKDDSTASYALTIACIVFCVNPNCDATLITSGLTSGYYSGEVEFEKPGNHKCSHGGPFDGSANGLEGINKDSSNGAFSPHGPKLHKTAIGLATDASVQFLRDLVEREGLSVTQLGLILGVEPTTASKLRRREEDIESGPTVFSFAGSNGEVQTADVLKETIIIDDSISALIITSDSGAALSGTITQPDSTTLKISDRPSKYISSPAPGTWSITASSKFTVKAISDVYLSSFRFLEPNGRPGHTGYFPVSETSLVKRDGENAAMGQYGNLIAVARFSTVVDEADFDIDTVGGSKLFKQGELQWKRGTGEDGIPENVFYANADAFADRVRVLRKEGEKVVVKVGGKRKGGKFMRERIGRRIGRKE